MSFKGLIDHPFCLCSFLSISISAWRLATCVDTWLSNGGGKDWWHLHWSTPLPPILPDGLRKFLFSFFSLSYTYESVQKVFLSFFSGTFRRGHCREHLLFSSARFPSYPHLGRATPLLWWANPPWPHQVLVGLLLIVSHLPAYRGGYIIRNWSHIYSICCWPH